MKKRITKLLFRLIGWWPIKNDTKLIAEITKEVDRYWKLHWREVEAEREDR